MSNEVKYVFKILMGLIIAYAIQSCSCDYYITSMKGLRSKKLYKKYNAKLINPETVGIETDVPYWLIAQKYYEEEDYLFKSSEVAESKEVLVFKKDGRSFAYTNVNLDQEDTLNPDKGDLNYLVNISQKKFFLDYSTINCGSFSKCEYSVNGDTLKIAFGGNKGYRIWLYYLKKNK